MAFQQQYQNQQQVPKTFPLKVLVDKQSNKVVFVEATKDFVDTLFSFLSLPLGTIVRLLSTNNNNDQLSESSPFLRNIINLYQAVENLNSNGVWNNRVCKQMLLHPRNPCESLCMNLFLNIDDTEPSTTFFVCRYCYMFTNFRNLNCKCGSPPYKEACYLDFERERNKAPNGAFIRQSGQMFLVSDDLKIAPSSLLTSMQMLMESGIANVSQLDEVTYNIGKKEILNLLKYALTSHEPLTNTLLASSSMNKCNSPNKSASTVRLMPSISDSSKMDIKVLQSKSQKKIIIAEADGDFVDFIFSFLTMPLGSVVKLLGSNSFAGCVGNLYKSVENLDPTSVLLNPGIAPQFGCPNQPLNIPHLQPPCTTYYHSPYCSNPRFTGGSISKSHISSINAKVVNALDPREGAVGFMKRGILYGVGDDLKVKRLSGNSLLSYLKELCLPLQDLEVKVISLGEAEALRFLGSFLTSKFTLTSGLQDCLNVPNLESTFSKVPTQESNFKGS